MKTRIEKLEEWLETKSYLGVARQVWIALALIVGIALEIAYLHYRHL